MFGFVRESRQAFVPLINPNQNRYFHGRVLRLPPAIGWLAHRIPASSAFIYVYPR